MYGTGPDGCSPTRPASRPAALVSIDDNGAVKALVGGQDYATSHGRSGPRRRRAAAAGARPGRPSRPFLLAETLKEGYSVAVGVPGPAGGRAAARQRQRHALEVTNFERRERRRRRSASIDATAVSVNTVYAQVVDGDRAASTSTTWPTPSGSTRPSCAPYASQVLGTADVSPLEMAAAYATFADGGVYIAPD